MKYEDLQINNQYFDTLTSQIYVYLGKSVFKNKSIKYTYFNGEEHNIYSSLLVDEEYIKDNIIPLSPLMEALYDERS